MSQFRKEFIHFLGKKFLKQTKPDSVWWYTKLSSKIALGIAWATIKYDHWYDKMPGDKGYIWTNERKLENLIVRELYIGRFLIGIAKTKEFSSTDAFVAIQDLGEI